ncbi:phage holin family protein [Clostridioides difficile]|nr:phage holin family protein [Clostridioides difficile]
MDIMQFIPQNLIMLIGGLYILGTFIKESNTKNKYIPFTLLIIAIISSCLFMNELSIEAIFEGILCWGASIGISQIQVQNKKEK